ncbi:MAG: YSIRK-type signal peptide-containing protein, partial [Aerococcus sp.]|nr:YSIRK-type signal peptide-containing protein [Aerococcus sp.]
MVGKNNKDLLTRRMSKRVTRWGIRRLNIGVASIAIASGFLLSSGLSEIAQAAEVQPQAAIEAASDTTTGKDGLQASADEKAERHTNDQATMAVARPSDDETVADNKADESAIADDEATVENKADDKAAEDDHATADRAADDDKAAADETANDQLDGSEETPKPQAVRASEYTVPDYTQKDSISHVTDLDNNFTKYGDIERFPYDYGEVHTEVLRFNNHSGTGAVNSVLQLDGKIDFSKDFTMKFEIAAEPQGITTGPDGFGFTFYNDTPENLKNAGGILNKQGLANAWGFRYDTGYHYDDPNDVKAKQAAAGYRGYGAFATNDGSGTTTVVGDINTFNYASNAATGFRGQNLNPLTISYNAATQTMTVTYAQYTWTTTLKALGVDPTQNYGFAITSEKANGRYSATGMRIRAVSADGIIDYTPEAKEQHATITYVDDTTGQNLKVDEVKGNSGTNANYDSQSVINGYTNSGHTFVSSDIPNGGIVFDTVDDKDGNASQNFTIHLKHQTVPVTPENPNGTNVDQLLHSVTQTIHYVDNTGKTVSADVTDDVVFRREGVKDLVTGKVTLGQWTAVGNDNTFEAKKSPIVLGYYADRVQVNASTVTADSPNQVINVIYNELGNLVPDVPGSKPVPYPNDPNDPTKPGKPQVPTYPGYTPIGPDGNPMAPGQTYPIDPTQPGKDTNIHYEPNIQHATVTYIDDVTKQTIYVENLTGGSGTKSQYTTADKIAELTGKGYQLVTDGYPTGGMTFDTDDYVNQNYEVHLTHKTVPVTPDKPEGTDINQLVHKVTQTVEYVYEDGKKAAETVIDEVTFERTGVKDLVTNTVTYGDWKAKGGDNTFDVKISPTINGYTPDAAQIQETVVDATAQSKDHVHKVTYKRNQQNATVVYIDDVTKQPIYTETLTGQSGTKSPYTTADKIAELTGKGYELVKDGYPAGGMTFDTDDAKDQVYEVHFVHQTVPVTPENPNGTDISQLVHKVTQTVHYVDEAGQKVANDVTDEVTFQREGTKDLVSGKVTFGDWKAKDGDVTFVAKVSPTINGYTTKTPEIAETTVAFDAQSKDHEHTVVYTKNDQKATVTFIDDVTKQPIHVETLTGKGGETSTYTTAQKIAELEKQGYKLVSNNFPTDGLTFDMDDTKDQAFEVHFEHQTKPVTPATPGDVDINELVHKVTQTVHYVDEAGQPVANDVTDEVTFERTGVKDLVTGDVTFEEWKAKDDDDTFEAKTSPIVKGYYAEKAQVEAITVTVKDTKDEQTVVYHKLGNLIPVDKDGQPIPGVDKVPYPNHPTDPTKPGEPVIPTVPGFTPVDKDGTPLTPGATYPVDPAKPGEDTTITYVADEQKVIVHYVDKTTGQEITTDTVPGKSGDKVNYSTADKIKELENKGYQLVSDGYPKDGLTFDNDKNTNQEYTVELAHRVVPVTPDKPGEPNKPVDPDNPDGPKYPEGTDKDSLSKDVTQTVH